MSFDIHSLQATSLIVTAPSPAMSGTSLTVTASTGTIFGSLQNAVVCPPGVQPTLTNSEVIRITNISTDTFTITRAQEGSSAISIGVGYQIFNAVTPKVLTDIETIVTTGNANTVNNIAASVTATPNELLPLDVNATYPQTVLQTTTLGYAQITSSITTTSTSLVQATGLSITCTIPTGGRRVKITFYSQQITNNSGSNIIPIVLFNGTVGSGTQLQVANVQAYGPQNGGQVDMIFSHIPSSGSITYNIGWEVNAGTGTIAASTTSPAFILAELI